MKILIVEDELTLLTFLERLFLGCGLEVKAFLTGFEAAEVIESWDPDLLISDLALPDISGEDLARMAACLPRPPRIVLMSGDADRLECASALAASVFLKPFRVLDLMKVVELPFERR